MGALDEVQEYYDQEFMGWSLDVSRPQNGEQYINWLKSMRSFIREGTAVATSNYWLSTTRGTTRRLRCSQL